MLLSRENVLEIAPLLDGIIVPCAVCTMSKKVIYYNTPFRKLFQLDKSSIKHVSSNAGASKIDTALNLSQLMPKSMVGKEALSFIQDIEFSGITAPSLPIVFSTPDGISRSFVLTKKKIKIKQQQYLMFSFVDETEKRLLKEEIRQKDVLLGEAQRTTNIGLFRFDVQVRTTFWSEQLYIILGLKKGDIVPSWKKILALMPKVDRKTLEEQLVRSRTFSANCRINRPDGEMRYLCIKGNQRFDGKGELLESYGTVQDITEAFFRDIELIGNRVELKGQSKALNSAAMVAEIGGDRKILYANTRLSFVSGYKKGELAGKIFYFDFYAEEKKETLRDIKEVMASGKVWKGIVKKVKKSGKEYWVDMTISPFEDENGEITKYIIILFETTGRVIAKKELEKLMHAIEQSADNVVITDINGIIEYANPAFMKLTGFNKEEILGKTHSIVKSSKHDKLFYRQMWQTILNGHSYTGEFINRKKSGEIYYEEKTITPVKNEAGVVTNFVSTGKDITEKKINERKINALNKLTMLQKEKEQKIRSWALITGQEQERKRLSREIHDGIGQMLTAIKLHTEGLKEIAHTESEQLKIKGVVDMLKETITEARKVSHALMPTIISDFGLISAINQLVDKNNLTESTRAEFIYDPAMVRFDQIIEISLYRIVQEAVNNALKHAKANKIEVILTQTTKEIQLIVKDDGVGFNTSNFSTYLVGSKSGIGLHNVKERVRALEGELNIMSKPGKGCKILIHIPNKQHGFERTE